MAYLLQIKQLHTIDVIERYIMSFPRFGNPYVLARNSTKCTWDFNSLFKTKKTTFLNSVDPQEYQADMSDKFNCKNMN